MLTLIKAAPPSSVGRYTFLLKHVIAVALVVGTIAVPVYLVRCVYRFVKKPSMWMMSYFLILGMILSLLPVSWSCRIFRIALPYMPDRIEDWQKKQQIFAWEERNVSGIGNQWGLARHRPGRGNGSTLPSSVIQPDASGKKRFLLYNPMEGSEILVYDLTALQ